MRTDIKMRDTGIEIQAKILESDPRANSIFVRVEYKVSGTSYKKNFYLKKETKVKNNDLITIRYLPENPKIAEIDFDPKKVASNMYYLGIFVILYLIYRSTKLMVDGYIPNS
ncbi:MAG: hypothetical protein HQM08_22185 [Candidatus Riflebacteria bacterium]|nr:hypothetical protein [Candidatus Riflebacteria bacterium]